MVIERFFERTTSALFELGLSFSEASLGSRQIGTGSLRVRQSHQSSPPDICNQRGAILVGIQSARGQNGQLTPLDSERGVVISGFSRAVDKQFAEAPIVVLALGFQKPHALSVWLT